MTPVMIVSSERGFRKYLMAGSFIMKGYNVEAGFMGFVDGDYILFANEADYTDYYAGAVED